MEWYESWKPYVALTVIASAIAMIYVAFSNSTFLGLFMPAIDFFVMFPIIMMSAYMWLTGKGAKFINGVDWSKLNEQETKNKVSSIGFWIMISMIIVMYGLAVIPSHVWIGLGILGVGSVLAIVIAIKTVAGGNSRPMISLDSVKALSILLVVTLVSLVPTTYIMTEFTSSESVDVTVGNESFTVKAPMFDHTFTYSEIDEIRYDADFDKGSRRMGYGTDIISSGKWKNAEFGNYELAAYTKVRSCIVISVGGDIYAFNQSSDDATLNLFNDLKNRIP